MTDTREAAQRIVEWVKLTGEGPADAWPTTCADAVEVARAYLALLDGSDERHTPGPFVHDVAWLAKQSTARIAAGERNGVLEEAAKECERIARGWGVNHQRCAASMAAAIRAKVTT